MASFTDDQMDQAGAQPVQSFTDDQMDQAGAQPVQSFTDDQMDQADAQPQPSETGRNLRTFARGVIPTIGGVAGAVLGAGAGAGIGSFVTGAAGAVASTYLAQKAQDTLSDAMGIDSPEQRAADAQNPTLGSKAAALAPTALALTTGAGEVSLGTRLAMGLGSGLINLTEQGVEKGVSNIDPMEALTAAGIGVALPKARPYIEGAVGAAVGRSPATVAETAPAKVAAGAPADLTAQGDLGIQAIRSSTEYPKGANQASEGGVQVAPSDPLVEVSGSPADPPDIAAAMKPPTSLNDIVPQQSEAPPGEAAPRPPVKSLNDILPQAPPESTRPPAAQAAIERRNPYNQLLNDQQADRRAGVQPKAAQDNLDEPLTPEELASPAGEPNRPARPATAPPDLKAQPTFPTSMISLPKATQAAIEGRPPEIYPDKTGVGSFTPPRPEGSEVPPTRSAQRNQLIDDIFPGKAPAPDTTGLETPPKVKLVPEEGSDTGYAIHDADGNRIASADIVVSGNKAKILNLYSEGGENSLGPAAMRDVMRQFQKQHPEVTSFEGKRVSGARAATAPMASVDTAGLETPPKDLSLPDDGSIPDFLKRPAPQSLSAAAPEGGASETYQPPTEPPGATRAKLAGAWQAVNKLADKAFGLPQRIFSPESISKSSEHMDTIIRSVYGPQAAKDVASMGAMKDAIAATTDHINKWTPDQRTSLVTDYERGTVPKDHPGAGIADQALKISKGYDSELERQGSTKEYAGAMPSMFEKGQQGPVRDFITQFKDNNDRYPTLGEIVKKGFPLQDDLLNADGSPDFNATFAQQNMMKSKVIEKNSVVEQGRERDGPSGAPPILSSNQVPGWERIDPSLTNNVPLYALPEVKTVLERYFNPWTRDAAVRDAVDGAMYIKNGANAWNLVGGTYHFEFMMQEGIGSDITRGLQRLGKDPIAADKMQPGVNRTGWGDIGKAIMAPYSLAKTGKSMVMDALMNPKSVTDPFQKEVLDNLAKGGNLPQRIHGSEVTPELETGFMNGMTTSWKSAYDQFIHDAVQRGLKVGNKFEEGNYAGAATGAGMSLLKDFSQGLQVLMHPLFNGYIPLMKAGVNYKNMATFMLDNPGLTKDQYVEMGKRYIKSTDNLMGELNQKTMYWPPMLKKAGNLLTVSLGWNVGDWRQFAGGMRSFVRDPSRALSGPDMDPRIMSIAGFAVVTSLSNSIYQYLKTGEPPKSLTDVVAPRTGGTAARSSEPERAILPGYLKDWLEAIHVVGGPEGATRNATHMAYSKLASIPRSAVDLMSNSDWSGNQIYNPQDPFMKNLGAWWKYAEKNIMEPIGYKQATDTSNPKTNISAPERAMGIRHAPAQWEKPEQANAGVVKRNKKAADEAATFHKRIGF